MGPPPYRVEPSGGSILWKSSVVHLTLMELDLGLERGKPAGALTPSWSRALAWPCRTPHVVGVQCEFLFRLRTETRSVLERKTRE
jgi:hypothetical protein